MTNQIEKFAEAVADFAVRAGMPTATTDDFDAAMKAYVSHAQEATDRLMCAGREHPVVKVFFHKSALQAQF